MAINLKKLFNTTKSKVFWLYIVVGALITIASIMLMPFWKNVDIFFSTWGYTAVDIIVGVLLILYIAFYLIKQVAKAGGGFIRALSIIELIILTIAALGCIVSQFNVLNFGDVSIILGVAFWSRGTIEIYRGFYLVKNSGKFTSLEVLFNIILITIGVFFAVSSIVNDTIILWFITITLLVMGLVLFVLGFFKKPKKVK